MKFTMYHTCITVLDLEKSMKFYEEALGLKEVRRIEAADGSSKIVFLETEGSLCQLELTWYADREEPYNLGDNEIHIGFRTDDYEASLQSTDRWAAFASRIRSSVCTLSRTRTATGWRSYRRAKAKTTKRRSK